MFQKMFKSSSNTNPSGNTNSEDNHGKREPSVDHHPELSDKLNSLSISEKTVNNGSRRTQGTKPNNVDKGSEISYHEKKEFRTDTVSYDAQRMVGHGSFGSVYLATVSDSNEVVAIKKVLQDRRFKNRELQIMKQISKRPHPYVVQMKHYFVSKGSGVKQDEVYLNLVLEYVPETIYSESKKYTRSKELMPIMSVKLYMYQLGRALGHIHGMGICHRDIKPQNLLVDPTRHSLKLCDFGSAKMLIRGEPNVAYICSRYYRAPELIFEATQYTTAIDVWSMGCVVAELLLGTPLFPGSSGADQIVEIIKILGTPTKDDIQEMNPDYQMKIPQIKPTPWTSVFKPSTPPDAIDLINRMLLYKPNARCLAIESCTHPFYDDLRNPATVLTDGTKVPQVMFEFTEEEMSPAPQLVSVLIPSHVTVQIPQLQSGATSSQTQSQQDSVSQEAPPPTTTSTAG